MVAFHRSLKMTDVVVSEIIAKGLTNGTAKSKSMNKY